MMGAPFPIEELQVIDFTIRMFTEPTLEGDVKLFERVQVEEWARQDELLLELGVSKKDIGSNGKFIALLEAEGVEVEYKPGKNGPIPAFSKTDDFMKELLEDSNERIATLANTRLSVRSTIDETRSGRLAGMARRGPLPIYLGYCGAHTTRWSGGDRVNFQNFPRKGDIRKGFRAPAGALLAVFDYSQIEARILNHVAGQTDICEAFASGRDLYSEGASRFYGRPINKKENPTERHLGKVIELGSGYGLGWSRLQATCRAGALGGPSIILSEAEARKAIEMYRSTHPKVVDYWREGDRMLAGLATWGGRGGSSWGPLRVEGGKIILPNGAPMHYNLRWSDEKRAWERETRTGWRKMWGGSLCISGEALVCTAKGWKRLDNVKLHDLIWDGEEFVKHEGLICRGDRYTIALDGVRMTPDHEVLTTEGWRRAMECEGYFRTNIRLPDGVRQPAFGWKTSTLGLPLRLWGRCRARRSRASQVSEEGYEAELRMHVGEERHSPYVEASGLRSLAFDERPLQTPHTSGLEKLRGAGDICLRALARKLRKFLGRYGRDIRAGTDDRTDRQQRRLPPKQLQMGDAQGAGEQPALLSTKVYDLLNCGPRRRFVVAGIDGPIIVHNCENVVQAMARVVMSQAAIRVKQRFGLRPVWTVHDELVYVLDFDPEDMQGATDEFNAILEELKVVPGWLAGCPLDVEGGLGTVYGEIK